MRPPAPRRQLQQRTEVLRKRGSLEPVDAQRTQLLVACAPCFGFDHQLALQTLPYTVLLLLRADLEASVDAIKQEVEAVLMHTIGEKHQIVSLSAPDHAQDEEPVDEPRGGSGAEEQLCCMAIFTALDSLQEWQSQHRSGRSGVKADYRTVECIDALLHAISHRKLAQAALHCGAHCRSLLYMEQALDQAPLLAQNFLSGREREPRQLTVEDAAQMGFWTAMTLV